jgi:hypothetical protein
MEGYNCMSERKTYVVTLHKGIDYNSFYADIETVTSNHPFVPDRIVDILNENPMSERNTHYALTDEEATVLAQDPRVMAVEIPPQDRDDLIIEHTVIQDGNFNKIAGQTSANYKNWGLLRSAYSTNIYGTGTGDNGYAYPYHLDGTGVDVVIHDSGLQVDHPEFTDKDGNSRVQQINWYLESGLYSTGTSIVNFSTSSQAVISSNSNINVSSNAAYSSFGSIGAAILIGAYDTAADYIGVGQDDGGRSYRTRFEGTSIYSGSAGTNTLLWETKFLDNGWVQVLMLRHDNYFSGLWKVQDWSGNTLADMSYFNNSLIYGSGAIPRSIVLTTNDGQTWQVNGGINTATNYHAVLTNGTWTLASGVATEGGQTGLSSQNIPARDDSVVRFNTPFSVPFVTKPPTASTPQSANHYRDYDGHGTHVAGIASGKTFGWAKGAKIYSLKVSGLEGSGDSGTGISVTDCFNLVKLWHRNKPVDPITGRKRPTVVNMSWGYGTSQTTVTSGNYRGTAWTTATTGYTSAIDRWTTAGIVSGGNGRWSVRVASVDADVQDLADEGVIVCIAAGNNYDKQDVLTGPDYNNYVVYSGGTLYYHRGSSPHSTTTFSVGCIDYDTYSGLERTAYFSTKGPGTNIWAPGRYIVSSTSQTNTHGGVTYYDNPNYKQLNISGTSMASPQICGMSALYLQVNPTAKFAEVYEFFSKNSKAVLYSTNTSTDYTNYAISLMGSENKVAYMPFAADIGIKTNATLK